MSDLALTNESLALQADQHPVVAFVLSLPSVVSRRSALKILDGVAAHWGHTWQTMDWASLTKVKIDALKAAECDRISERTGKPLSSASINKMIWAVRGTLGAAFDLGLIDAAEWVRIQRVKGVRSDRSQDEDSRPGRYVAMGERQMILNACADGTDAGQRDAAILFLLIACGLRRGEIPRLEVDSIKSDDGDMLAIEVWGKGRKRRVVYLNGGGRLAMLDWLDVRGREAGPLFWRGRRGGHLERGKPIGQHSVYGLLGKRRLQAGVADLATHDLRRSYISDLLGLNVDIATVASLVGHSSVVTTAQYDRRGSQAKIEAARALHFAYVPRQQQDRLV